MRAIATDGVEWYVCVMGVQKRWRMHASIDILQSLRQHAARASRQCELSLTVLQQLALLSGHIPLSRIVANRNI